MPDYDYVIVGAGSAGCVLANRLSTDGDVLLLEAGEPDDEREMSVPLAYPELWGSSVDWVFETEAQPELDDRTLDVVQGKTIGGSSSINAQVYLRGHPADYDGWAAAGNDGWDHETVIERFERIEDGPGDPYGEGGPQHVAEQGDPHPLSSAFVDAAVETGLRRRECLNDGPPEGVGYTDVIQKGHERHSAADAFLKPVLDRPSLTAETGARVRRVVFDGDRATGVVYDQAGGTTRATVREEVILSAGAINSPRLLMLSGVGPADHLREYGIEVRADRPGVGRNLQDHPIVYLPSESETDDTHGDADSLVNLLKYLVLKRGPLTSNGLEAAGYWRSDGDLAAPDVQFVFAPAYLERGELVDGTNGFSIGTALVHPQSRGRVTLRSDDPDDDPAIDPQYLAEDDDLAALRAGVRKAREIADADPLATRRANRDDPHDRPEETIRSGTVSYAHFAGTCKMGDGEMAVVDDRLRVRGVEGLRVVDASVMPTIPRVNTHAPTTMVAEYASEFVTGDARSDLQ
ncbi:choline dehydrogenase [Halobacteriales archaeon QS_8_69_26]|nr:MAG: choline dehydrogenase [Halobacteriales archaeon QS_8_69_26]